MKIRALSVFAAFCMALAAPAAASAQTIAYAVYDGYTNVRAGPSADYPIVAQVYPGTRVDVLGCLETRAWCDIVVQGIRGWIYARRLEFLYSGRRYLVPDYYSYFGAPFVIFRFGDGYRRHYHRHDRGDDGYRPRDRYLPRDSDIYRGGRRGRGGDDVDLPRRRDQYVPDAGDRSGRRGGRGGDGDECRPRDGGCGDRIR